MKTSTKLFILTAIATVTGLIITNYSLSKSYSAIDKTNPYYTFDKIETSSFKHIKIVGGNASLADIKIGEENGVFINKKQKDLVDLTVISDTLTIKFVDELTHELYGHIRESDNPTIIINNNMLHSLTSTNAATRVYLTNTENAIINADSSSITHLYNLESLECLELNISGTSHLDIKQNEQVNLPLLKLNLLEEGSANLQTISPDSLSINMSDKSVLTIGADFTKS